MCLIYFAPPGFLIKPLHVGIGNEYLILWVVCMCVCVCWSSVPQVRPLSLWCDSRGLQCCSPLLANDVLSAGDKWH